jgi:hypothetical protein
MKRKVIQIAESTQLISLPRRWAMKYNVKKGDELEVIEKDNSLEITTNQKESMSEITINITGLNRTSIYHTLRSAYQRGYDIINVKFDNKATIHYRTGENVLVSKLLHQELQRWVGMQIIEQKENYFVFKSISKPSFEEYDLMFRRACLLLIDACDEFVRAAEKKDEATLQSMDEKFYTILTFINYCQRLLNKVGHSEKYKNSLLYSILICLNQVGDILRYGARDLLVMDKINPKTAKLIEEIFSTMRMYYDLYYKFELQKFSEIYKKRDNIIREIAKISGKIPTEDLMLLVYCRQMLEVMISAIKVTVTYYLEESA